MKTRGGWDPLREAVVQARLHVQANRDRGYPIDLIEAGRRTRPVRGSDLLDLVEG